LDHSEVGRAVAGLLALLEDGERGDQ